MIYFNHHIYIVALLVLLVLASTETKAQQSIQLPREVEEEVMQVDELFAKMENLSDDYLQERRNRIEEVQHYESKSKLDVQPDYMAEHYYAKAEKARAQILKLDHDYYKEISRIGAAARRYSRAFKREIEQSDFGEQVILDAKGEIKDEILEAEYSIKNMEVMQDYGELTAREMRILANDIELQKQVMHMWIDNKKWYSQKLQQTQKRRSQFEEVTDFAASLIADARQVEIDAQTERRDVEEAAAVNRDYIRQQMNY